VTHQKVNERRIEDRGSVKLLAGDGRADDRKNAGPNDRADAESGERERAQGLLEGVRRRLGVRDQLVDRFTSEEL
jgi:hypothetical protein